MRPLLPKEPLLAWHLLARGGRGPGLPRLPGAISAHDFFWGRSAIYHGLRALGVGPGDAVLVPAFHCASAIEPVIRVGAEPRFYAIRRDGSVDLDDASRRIDGRIRALMAIHYFGIPQPVRAILAFCRAHRISFVEDCAHVLTGDFEGTPLGGFGDVSIFSWRKFLPVYDGGRLLLNAPGLEAPISWSRVSALLEIKAAKNLLERAWSESPSGLVRGLSALADRPARVLGRILRASRRSPQSAVSNYVLDFDEAAANLPMTRVSSRIASNVDPARITARRRENYEFLADAVALLPGARALSPTLGAGLSPWVFPFAVDDGPALLRGLLERGVPGFNWSQVIHGRLRLDEFPDARWLFENLIFLPVHQDLNREMLRTMVAVIRELLAELGRGSAPAAPGNAP
jgi:perosamine synthetase